MTSSPVDSRNLRPPLTAGGAGSDLAVIWGDRILTYTDFDAAVEAAVDAAANAAADAAANATANAAVGEAGHSDVFDASELDLPDALICVFAAAKLRAAVRVEDPSARPHRPTVPPGAFLLVGTSGSTGRPRPLARTAESWTDSFDEFTAITGITASDIVLITGPLHATMHLFAAVHALWLGACITDDPAAATVAHAVPAVLRTLVDAPNVRVAVVAGTRPDDDALRRAKHLTVVEYYGAAELSLVAARVVPGPLRLMEGVDAVVRDELLFVRSPYRALGVGEWVGVGDLAELGPDREIVVHGRGSAAVDVGGTTVVAEDVERVLDSLRGVRASAVVGVPHAVLGETVAAVLELEDGTDLSAVKAGARAVLQKEAVPRRWTVVDALPRTGSGKIARGRVKDLWT